jgi:hypothetical protein
MAFCFYFLEQAITKHREAMQSMSSLDVKVSVSCMLVEIDRPWMHAELFVDAELDFRA